MMNKKMSKLLALAMASAMVLAGCGGTETPNKPEDSKKEEGSAAAEDKKEEAKEGKIEEIKDLVTFQASVNEMETFNILYANNQKEHDVLCNVWDGLLETDPHGRLVPCLAKEWGSEDGGQNWTFKLREGVKWVNKDFEEKADCNAQDFATGLEWVLNFHKNSSNNTSMPIEMIKGAKEYYEYTKTLSAEEALALTGAEGSKFREMVGIEIPDDYTIKYACTGNIPYFDSLGAYVCLYPLSQAMVDELGGPDGVRSMDYNNMWSNGCYAITTYVQNNEKVFTKNPTYWDTECKRFDTATVKMVESGDVGFQMYKNGEIDEIGLSESNLSTITANKDDPFNKYLVERLPTKYSWQVHFNFDKQNEDGTPDVNWNKAIANEAFRKSWYYGLDLRDTWRRKNLINPMSCENNAYTMKGLCYTSDGKDYVDLVREKQNLPEPNGETPVRLDKEKAAEYKKQAMEELTAIGVTFPIQVDYYIQGSNQFMLDSANVLSQVISDSLGDDYVKLNIKTYVQSVVQEVYNAKKHGLVINGWGADYGDPQNYMIQEVMDNDNAYYAVQFKYINDVKETPETKELLDTYREFTRMVNEAGEINDDMDARYDAFAEAEAYMINHALCFPNYYDVGWCMTHINPYSKMNAMYGSVNGKMKNWETQVEPYTTEQMEKIAADYKADK